MARNQQTFQQIAQYAYNAGFRGVQLVYATAIAWVESNGGDANAYNPETQAGTPSGSGSRGLWQIYGNAHPEFNNDTLYDPQKNADAAFKVYQQAGNAFTPWSTFNSGAFKPFITEAEQAVGGLGSGAGVPVPPSPTTTSTGTGTGGTVAGAIGGALPKIPGLASVLAPFETALEWLTNPGRIVKLVAGMVILFIAIYVTVEPRVLKVYQQAAKNAAALGTV